MPNINKPNQHFDVITYTGNGKAVTVNGNTQISTAQSKFGGSSAYFDGTGDYLNFNGESDFAFGTGDFTIEFWNYNTNLSSDRTLIEFKSGSPTGTLYPIIFFQQNKFKYFVNGDRIISTTTPVINTWYHIAVCRSGTSTKLFINGTQEGSTYSDSNDYIVSSLAPRIGINSVGNNSLAGYLDDLRIYKGVAKYTANFTAPTAALPIGPTDPYWQYCVLAMPMDGTNASTTFPAFSYNASTDSALSFQPDLVWIKGRSGATDHAIYDAVRGATKDLASNLASAEVTSLNGLGVFNANGFTVGNLAKVNTSAATYAAWCWKAGNSTSTNTNGSITSTVSVNPTAGFSVATFTSPSTGVFTVGHGLGAVPKFILIKNRDLGSGHWSTFHSSISTDTSKGLQLSTSGGTLTAAGFWGNALPNSTVISMTGGGTTYASATQVMYSWAEVPGFSSFGSYTGNGNANGPFINLGFRPALVIIKNASAAVDWCMFDEKRPGYNVTSIRLHANAAIAEDTSTDVQIDILSNGFKVRGAGTFAQFLNTNGSTYIYCAWAENPFKYSLAR